jgi:hypothetical protein
MGIHVTLMVIIALAYGECGAEVQMESGIIYVATGDRYRDEAVGACASLRQFMPHVPVVLFTDIPEVATPFDHVIVLDNPTCDFADKIRGIQCSPFARTIFLDTDTCVCDDISDLFDLLAHFDLAAAHTVGRENVPIEGVPYAFTELNTGVLAFRKTPGWNTFCQNWLDLYQRVQLVLRAGTWEGKRIAGDQPSFRELLYHSDLRFTTLPPEYNCRFDAGYLHGKAHVIHQRGMLEDRQQSAAMLNSITGKRVHLAYHPHALTKQWKVPPESGASEVFLLALGTQQARDE